MGSQSSICADEVESICEVEFTRSVTWRRAETSRERSGGEAAGGECVYIWVQTYSRTEVAQ